MAERLNGEGLALDMGPVTVRIRSPFRRVQDGIELLYADYPVVDATDFCDYDCEVAGGRGLRRWWRPQTLFVTDGRPPFKPLPGGQSLAILEWGLNWCVSGQLQRYLVIHAAVIARDGLAAVFPAPPGSGKSTLCAGLVCRGWRLLSDELCLVDLATGELVPMPRPVSLKNASIEVIRAFAPEAVLGPVTHDTLKGSVGHMRAPRDSVLRAKERARLAWVVFPQYQAGASLSTAALPPGEALIHLADNAFNFHVHGAVGFNGLADMIEKADCLRLSYSRLPDAVEFFDGLLLARGAEHGAA
ncbi:HprK-related kinase A [Pelomonas sp. SE-A7]|uniref:HprK-related kinase A n=1 Tax=Pelomonas sp. SE-A7 TaxID=3054953 RepID=UPI00259C9B82|nr:HprK-related kinase A [Pelomonas sp. SE-A7]MDM4768215.1 HprK-related kinase A [Pelomonas sp. SE-A7]